MRNVSIKSCRENQTHILCSKKFFLKIPAVYKAVWKYMAKQDRSQMTI